MVEHRTENAGVPSSNLGLGTSPDRRRRLVVIAAFAAMFTVFGVAYSFGAFFEPMAREFGIGRASTSAVFAITACLSFVLGSVSGHVADRIGPRRVLIAGTAALVAGLSVTAAAPSIWVAYAGYGAGVGIGVACGYVPMVACVGGWYERGRSMAIGIAVTGIGMGTLLGAPLAALLIGAAGWRRAYLVLAAGSAVILLVAAVFAERPPAARAAPDGGRSGSAARTRPFWLLYLSGILVSFALFIAFVHLAPFAAQRGASPVAAAGLVGIIGIASVAGRLGLGLIAGRLGSVRSYQLTTTLLGASFAIWLLVPSYPGLVVFAAALGIGYGGWVALGPSVVADIFGTAGLGATVGLVFTSAAVGSLVGPPFAGFVVDQTGSYTAAIALAAGLGLAAVLPALALRGVVTSG